MNLFKKIKSDLDKKIEDDKMSANEKSTETFSVKSILDGRILLHSGFRRMIPLIVCLFILSIAYIKNRFSYEALVVKNNELKEIKTDPCIFLGPVFWIGLCKNRGMQGRF